MGNFSISLNELICFLSESLDNIDGDFTKEQLLESLEKLKDYPYISDYVSIKKTKKWNAFIKRIGNG
jgi:hypothetical protein